ncbi:hypothetical protein [Roseobacter sp.]|uniref:hypothetical protein n=1 Tax=Roseobacter sp. TaxID=1907202 RepID=UPI00385B52BC
MAFENNTNLGRVEKMIETLHLIEKSATANRATEAQIRATLAPLIEALARERAKQDRVLSAALYLKLKETGDETHA